MQYSVTLKDISENDQLVLRLIFSLSAKARGRAHAYCLNEPDVNAVTDICIQARAEQSAAATDTAHRTVWLGEDEAESGAETYLIRKPLIASRVLGVLDRYVKEQQPGTDEVQAADPACVQPQTVADEQVVEAELEFCISEEEASQLAIVDDETLSNPANESVQQGIAPASAKFESTDNDAHKVTSLLVLHKNKEIEISQQAFDNRLLDEPVVRPRALVVDDSPSVRKQIELELDLFNVDVDFAESVADATAQLQTNQYDVAFLDVVLPDGDGFQICRNIKAGANKTSVIMLTGKATPADKVKGTMAGCDAYLVKPVGRMTFQNTVCSYLQLREQLEVIRA